MYFTEKNKANLADNFEGGIEQQSSNFYIEEEVKTARGVFYGTLFSIFIWLMIGLIILSLRNVFW